jgi:uncharacterized protein (TIGR03546 family)
MLAVFRGQVSPVFVFLSILLGFWFGLTPGWSGIHTVMVIVVLILNVHLGLFLLAAGLGKAVCFAAAPILFHLGVWVHEYLFILLRILAMLPLIAITDFDKYSVAGAMLAGPIIGAVAGLLLAGSVISFRKMLLKFEESSETFKKWYSRRWVRIVDRLLIGKRTKDAKSLFEAKLKLFRMPGVIVAVVIVAVLVFAIMLLKDERARGFVATKMTQANGAEVNLDEFELSPLAGSIMAAGLQVTNSEKPQLNQFSVGKIDADIGLYDLFLGKLVMEKVEVSDVQFDQPRAEPGEVVQKEDDQKEDVFDPCDFTLENLDVSKLENYFKNAQSVKAWLQKVRKWLPKSEKEAKSAAREIPEKYLAYLNARASTPMSPRVLAKKILLGKVQVPWQLLGSSDISIENINDSPRVAGLPIAIAVKSNDTPASMDIKFDCIFRARAAGVG